MSLIAIDPIGLTVFQPTNPPPQLGQGHRAATGNIVAAHSSTSSLVQCAVAVQAVQASIAAGRLQRASAQTWGGCDAPVGRRGVDRAPSCVPAFLRLLPQEVPGCAVDSTELSFIRPHPGRNASKPAGIGNTFGSREAAAKLALPRLVVREPEPSPPTPHVSRVDHLTGGGVVTGGLGSLGMLYALWLSSAGGAGASVALLGRSGRAGPETVFSGRLMRGAAVVQAVRADMSAASEVAALLDLLEGSTARSPIQVRDWTTRRRMGIPAVCMSQWYWFRHLAH